MATPYKPLTEATWGTSYLNQYMIQKNHWGWPAQADLAHGLHDALPFLSIDTSRVLVESVALGLPVVITRLSGARHVGIVKEFHASADSLLRLREWGFTTPIPMREIANAVIMVPDLLAAQERIAVEPCSTCGEQTEIINGERRHCAGSPGHLPQNYDPDAELHPGQTRAERCAAGDHEACLRGECTESGLMEELEGDPIDLQDEARGDFTPGL